MSPWFFLSYARDKRDTYLNRYLPQFYKDLNDTIRSLVGPGKGKTGFLDVKSVDVGMQWRDTIAEALQNCRAFVSLYSQAYFNSEFCGKEWQVFRLRQAAYSASLPEPGELPPLLMPVLWVPEDLLPNPLPGAAASVQFNHSDLGELYAQEGLLYLLKIDDSKTRKHYVEFLDRFARKLIHSTQAHTLPRLPHLPPIHLVENAFDQPGSEMIEPAEERDDKGPRTVKFVFVAGRRDELRDVRHKLDPYGDKGGCDWHPYLPEIKAEVGSTARQVASDGHLEFIELEGNIIKQLREAERKNNVVAIIVDTWTLNLPIYSEPMLKYDSRNFLNCVVLVAWNNRDDELTETKRAKLKGLMKEIFVRNVAKEDRNCFLEVNSHEELQDQLYILLDKARARIRLHGEVMKKAGSGGKPPGINNTRRASA